MTKIITLRHAAKCKVCKVEIPAGHRAIWFGSKAGVMHIECQTATENPGGFPAETVFIYHELRQDYLASMNGKGSEIMSRSANVSRWNDLSAARETPGNWAGSTNAEMRQWLEIGYMVPGLDGVNETLIPAAPKRKLRFTDEGDEMLIDLAWSGVDEHFISWDKRDTKPSIHVKVNIAFSSSVPARIINAYQSWVARMLATVDSFGMDMQIDLISPGTNQMQGNPAKHTVVIRVKQSGETNDFSNWSPMFSPGGFRQLTFLGIIESADRSKVDVGYGLGTPAECHAWDLKYDPESNILAVSNNNDGRDFPEAMMTQKLKDILASITNK